MKLKEPDKVAKATVRDEVMDYAEAQENRANEFWKVLELYHPVTSVKDGRVIRQTNHCPDCIRAAHDAIKDIILRYLKRFSDALADGKCFDLPSGWGDEQNWNEIKFIIAFDTSFEYVPDDEEDDDENGEESSVFISETDYLDEESTFRYDIVKECDRLALVGAALAKRIGSDSYRLWADAMIKLGDRQESIQCKAVDDIVSALVRIWADLRTWIFMNPQHNAKKVKTKAKKTKK